MMPLAVTSPLSLPVGSFKSRQSDTSEAMARQPSSRMFSLPDRCAIAMDVARKYCSSQAEGTTDGLKTPALSPSFLLSHSFSTVDAVSIVHESLLHFVDDGPNAFGSHMVKIVEGIVKGHADAKRSACAEVAAGAVHAPAVNNLFIEDIVYLHSVCMRWLLGLQGSEAIMRASRTALAGHGMPLPTVDVSIPFSSSQESAAPLCQQPPCRAESPSSSVSLATHHLSSEARTTSVSSTTSGESVVVVHQQEEVRAETRLSEPPGLRRAGATCSSLCADSPSPRRSLGSTRVVTVSIQKSNSAEAHALFRSRADAGTPPSPSPPRTRSDLRGIGNRAEEDAFRRSRLYESEGCTQRAAPPLSAHPMPDRPLKSQSFATGAPRDGAGQGAEALLADLPPQRLICSQFSLSGYCSFGARCRYYHSKVTHSADKEGGGEAPRGHVDRTAFSKPLTSSALPFTRMLKGPHDTLSTADMLPPRSKACPSFTATPPSSHNSSLFDAACDHYIAGVPVSMLPNASLG